MHLHMTRFLYLHLLRLHFLSQPPLLPLLLCALSKFLAYLINFLPYNRLPITKTSWFNIPPHSSTCSRRI